jgi:hypothetical protein
MMPANDPGSFSAPSEKEEDRSMTRQKGKNLLSRKLSEMKEEENRG